MQSIVQRIGEIDKNALFALFACRAAALLLQGNLHLLPLLPRRNALLHHLLHLLLAHLLTGPTRQLISF